MIKLNYQKKWYSGQDPYLIYNKHDRTAANAFHLTYLPSPIWEILIVKWHE